MRRIRVGNDIWVRFAITLGGELVELPPIEEVSVAVENISRWSETLQLHELAATDGVVSFHIRGADTIDELNANKYLGKYRITISYEQLGALHTLDAVAFELVQLSHLQGSTPHNCPELAVETVELTGDVATGKNGITPHIGDNGNWWLREEDTGMPSRGRQGDAGKPAYQSAIDGGLPEHITEEDFNQYLAMNSEIIGEALDEINGEGYNDNVVKKITRLDATKQGIAGAIVAKGVPVAEADTFVSYATKIGNILGEIEKLYKESGYGYALGQEGILEQMARASYEITKDWTDYSKARGNKKIRFIPLLDTSSVTDMGYAFASCSSLTSIPLLDTSSVTSMTSTFVGCSSLTSIPLLDTSSVTDMGYAFNGCSSLTSIPLLDTSSVTSMTSTFASCSSLTSIPLLDTSSVTDMGYAFNGCSSLTSIPLLDTSSVTSMTSTFTGCSYLTSIPLLDTSSVTSMTSTFNGCRYLTSIPLLDTSSVTRMSLTFNSCSSLTTLGGFKGLKVDIDLSASTRFTVESMMNVIRHAADRTGLPTFTITFGATNLAKLTAEQKAEATNKNITLR